MLSLFLSIYFGVGVLLALAFLSKGWRSTKSNPEKWNEFHEVCDQLNIGAGLRRFSLCFVLIMAVIGLVFFWPYYYAKGIWGKIRGK